jgi:hypothetical protein
MADKSNRKGLFSGTGEFPEDTYGYTTQRRNTTGLPLGAELAVDFTPVVGDIKAGIETADYLRQGDYENALLSGIGVLPFVPSLAGSILDRVKKRTPEEIRLIEENKAKLYEQRLKERPKKESITDTSYRMQHQPRGPMEDNPIRLDDLTRSTTGEVAGYPEDFYSSKGLQYYANPNYKADVESYNLIRKLRGKPDAEVTIYRGVPKGVKNINEGDFVTLSKQYAKDHAASGYGRSGKEAGDVIEMKVKVKDIFWDGNDVNEFGYFPESSVVKTSRAQIIE